MDVSQAFLDTLLVFPFPSSLLSLLTLTIYVLHSSKKRSLMSFLMQRSGRGPGVDGITAEVIKLGGAVTVEWSNCCLIISGGRKYCQMIEITSFLSRFTTRAAALSVITIVALPYLVASPVGPHQGHSEPPATSYQAPAMQKPMWLP